MSIRQRLPLSRWPAIGLAVLALSGALLFGRPVLRWVWVTFIRPPAEKPMLPYGELRVGVDASYPPFAVDTGNGQLIGLDIDLARAVADRLSVPVRFINMGYDGLYDALRADQADALFSALRIDPLRLHEARYTAPYFDAGQVLVRPPDTGIDSLKDMDGRRLAVEFGTEGDLEARRWERRLHALNILVYETAAAALDAVRAGEADAALVDAISARLWLRDHDGLALAPEYVTSDPYAVAVQVGNVKLWEAINTALAALAEDGTLDAIIARWL